MIELRWVERSEPAPEFGENTLRKVKVLQYRQKVTKGAWAFEPPADAFKAWSDWQDVPELKEDKP